MVTGCFQGVTRLGYKMQAAMGHSVCLILGVMEGGSN